MGRKNCPNCDVKRTPGYDICLSCGFKFDTDQDNKEKKKTQKLIAITQLVIGLIIGIVIIILLLYTNVLPIVFLPITIIIYIIIIAVLIVLYACLHG